jgi:NADPH:quinone reductase-like Zn-dependent oxidoreductase
MKAAITIGFGGADQLVVRDDVPTPVAGPGEALVRVSACCCNNSDIWLREGAYGREDDPDAMAGWLRGVQPPRFPLIQGADIVGQVISVGTGAPEHLVGKRVLVNHTLYDDASDEPYNIAGIIGSEKDGGFAEFATVPIENVGVITSDFTDVEVAALGSASFVTAIRMIERARLAAGETVLVTGASGGVGTAAVQLAKLVGARVVAMGNSGKEAQLRSIGAEVVVPSRSMQLSKDVIDAAGGRVDVVLDVVGGPIFPDLLKVLKALGRYVVVGAVAGPIATLDLRTLYLKHLDLLGSTLGSRSDFELLVGMINEKKLIPVVGGVFALDDIHSAQEAFRSKQYVGNIVIRTDSST